MESHIKITEEKLKASEMVEVVMETEAHSGMSGISLSGGGKEGLFIADILKDSPAAKILPILEGDQLISARVYFENVKYEEALKILQFMEAYKASFCLKRTVPSSDVTISEASGSVEVKGPKAKMPKMTVKNLTPVKKKKKKVSGQVKVSEEGSMEAMKGSEISVGNMDIPPVDVEFSFPKFSKLLKTKGPADSGVEVKTTEVSTKVSSEQGWTKMRFPRLRVKEAAGAGVSTEVVEGKVAMPKAGIDVEGKDKSVAAKFGISVPKMKKPKVDVPAPKTEVKISPPKVEMETKEGKAFKTPQVELDISLPSINADTPEICAKMPKIPDVEIKVPTSHIQVEAPEGQLSMPQISKVGICSPKLEQESDIAIQVDGRAKTEVKLPSVEIAAPKLDVDLSLPNTEGVVEIEPPAKGFQIKLPKFGMSTKGPETEVKVSLPKVKKEVEATVTGEKFKVASIKTPEIGISLPKGREGDSPDGKPKVSMKMPSLDVSAPKLDVDITLPKGVMELGDGVSESIGIPDVALPKISPPKVGMKVKDAYSETTKAKWEMPQVELKAGKIEAEVESPDMSMKMPKISLPKFGTKGEAHVQEVEVKKGKVEGESPDFKLKGPKIKLPSFGLSLSKEKPEVEVTGKEAKIETDTKQRFPSIKMPSLDISLPKSADFETGSLEVSGPSIKAPEVEGSEGLDLLLKMPKVSLPKFDMSIKAEKPQVSPPKVHAPKSETKKIKERDLEVKGEKMTFPKVDISIPKIKPVDLDVELPEPELDISVEKPKVGVKMPKVGYHAIAFSTGVGDMKMGIPSVKMPSLDIGSTKLDIDLNLPKAKDEPLMADVGGGVQMPKITLPRLSDVAKDMAVELDIPKVKGDLSFPHFTADLKGAEVQGMDLGGIGSKISLPKVGIDLGRDQDVVATGMELKEKPDIKLPKLKLETPDIDLGATDAKITLPPVKLPFVEIPTPKIPDVDIDASLPKLAVDLQGSEDAAVEIDSDTKWKAPKFSLRKLGLSGSKAKKDVEGDAKHSHGEGDIDAAGKGFKMKMPKFGVSFPKAKHDLDVDTSKLALEADAKVAKGKKGEVSVEGTSEGKVKLPSVKLPSLDISTPKLEVDIDLPKGEGKASPGADKPSDISIDIPDIKLNLPKFSMPKFGSRSKGGEAEVELESSKDGGKRTLPKSTKGTEVSAAGLDVKVKSKEGRMKMPSLKMPSFGMSKKDVEVIEAKMVVKDHKLEEESLEGGGKSSFIKMPTFKMSPPKIQAPDVSLAARTSREDLRLPDVHVKVPQIALPSLGSKEGKVDVVLPTAEATIKGLAEGPEKIKMPSLEISGPTEVPALQISVPCGKPEICIALPKAEVDVSDADIKGYGGDLKIPKLPSFGVSAPSLGLDISLPTAKLDTSLEHQADLTLEKPEAKIKMPKVEISKFGGEADARVDMESSKYKIGDAEAKLKGPKVKMPHFDISLPKIRPDEDDIPFIEGEVKMHGANLETSATEGTFSLPSVELPKMSTPKMKAPELELDINLGKEDMSKTHKAELSGPEVGLSDIKFKMPKMRLPKFGGSGSGINEEASKLDVKSPKTEDSGDSGMMGFKIKMPKLQVGSLKGKGGEEMSLEMEGEQKKTTKGDMKVTGHEESEDGGRFKIKMPSFGMSKDEASREPLYATKEGAELKFKMPALSIPDVGFSGDGEEGAAISKESGRAKGDFGPDAKMKGPKSSSIEDLEIDVGLKMPKLKMPTISMPGRKTEDDMTLSLEEDSEGKKSSFKMPDVELSSPKIKAHAEYDVGGAKIDSPRVMVLEGSSTKKSSKSKEETKDYHSTDEDSGKKYKVKLPKFGVSLPKPIAGDVELSTPKLKSEYDVKASSYEQGVDQQEAKKAKKTFSLGRSKDKSSGLLTLDVDTSTEELKVKMPKIKMKPTFGLSPRSKTKGTEVNGEFDAGTKGEADTDHSPDGTTKSSKIKFPRLGFSSSKTPSGDVNGTGRPGSPSQINGENELSAQNGSQDGGMKIGKLKLPKVEFSSTYKGKESDSEMSLKLVKTEEPESKEEDNSSSFAGKFKSPKFTFAGFKKKDKGEEHLVGSTTRTEMSTEEGESKTGRAKISLGFLSSKSKGEYTVDNTGIPKEAEGDKEKTTKYKLPKVSLSPESELQTGQAVEETFTINMPMVGFTTHHEEHTTTEEEKEVAGGFLKITKQIKTETVTEKTVSI